MLEEILKHTHYAVVTLSCKIMTPECSCVSCILIMRKSIMHNIQDLSEDLNNFLILSKVTFKRFAVAMLLSHNIHFKTNISGGTHQYIKKI